MRISQAFLGIFQASNNFWWLRGVRGPRECFIKELGTREDLEGYWDQRSIWTMAPEAKESEGNLVSGRSLKRASGCLPHSSFMGLTYRAKASCCSWAVPRIVPLMTAVAAAHDLHLWVSSSALFDSMLSLIQVLGLSKDQFHGHKGPGRIMILEPLLQFQSFQWQERQELDEWTGLMILWIPTFLPLWSKPANHLIEMLSWLGKPSINSSFYLLTSTS